MSSTGRKTKRVEHDFYPTPNWCMDRLYEALPLPDGKWLDPAAGDGAFLKNKNVNWTALEIQPKFRQDLEVLAGANNVIIESYLTAQLLPIYNVIITNPPFSLALEFIKRSIELKPKFVIMLLRLNFLGSLERSDYLREHMPDIYVLPNRPSFNGKGKTDSIEYAWFVWSYDKQYGKSSTGNIKLLADTPAKDRKK